MLWAGVTGSISGTVLAGASVTAVEPETGAIATTTDTRGLYALPALPVGRYDLGIANTGFASYRRMGIVQVAAKFLF